MNEKRYLGKKGCFLDVVFAKAISQSNMFYYEGFHLNRGFTGRDKWCIHHFTTPRKIVFTPFYDTREMGASSMLRVS